jgi:hypothetical protein
MSIFLLEFLLQNLLQGVVEMNFVGIDPGNSRCKYSFEEYIAGKKVIRSKDVPNVTGEAIELDVIPTGKEEDLLAVQIHSADDAEYRKPVFIGNLALSQLRDTANQDRDRDKAEGDGVNLIIPAILGMLYPDQEIVLGVGATLTDFKKQAPLLEQKLTREHVIEFLYGEKMGKTVKVNVVDTFIYPQAAAGLYSVMQADDGTIRRMDLAESNVLVIDGGHGQVNVALVQAMNPIKKACFATDDGFYKVVLDVQNYLNVEHYISTSIPQLQKAVEQGFYEKNNNRIDLQDVLGESCGKLVKMIYREVKSKFDADLFNSINLILIMGGSAEILAPFIQAIFNLPVEIAPKALHANSRGLLLIARENYNDNR